MKIETFYSGNKINLDYGQWVHEEDHKIRILTIYSIRNKLILYDHPNL